MVFAFPVVSNRLMKMIVQSGGKEIDIGGLDAKNAKAENRVAIPAYTGVLACPSFLPPGRVIGN